MKPADALEKTIFRGVVDSVRSPVGKIVERMSPETREALARLTPEDVARPRMDWLGRPRRRGRFNMAPVAPPKLRERRR